MTFKLSSRSEARLEGLDPRLIAVVKSAIHKSKIDFGVICGMRTLDEQKELVAKGASQYAQSGDPLPQPRLAKDGTWR